MKLLITKNKNTILISALVYGILFLFGCGSVNQVASGWRDAEIKIDGSLSDWNRNIQKVKEEAISVGFRNDDRFLYICLTSEHRGRILTLLKDGLTVWFEPESGENNIFGIQYPITSPQIKFRDISEMIQGGMRGEDPEKMIRNLIDQQNELQILNRDRFPVSALPILNDEGIEARIDYRSGQLVYELKVPLLAKKGFSYAADTAPGGKIKIRFESEELIDDSKGGLKSIGMAGGGYDNRPSHMGRRRGTAGGTMVETLHHEVELKLDSAPANR